MDFMTEIYWCSVGFSPEDVAEGKCKEEKKYEHGCHNCPDWKLTPVENIIDSRVVLK